MNSPPTVDDMMVAYAQDAIDYAAQRFNVQLDYSEASVERVEAILAQLFETVP